MHIIENSTEHLWVLCHDGTGEIIHTIELLIGNTIETGQPYMETFTTEEDMNSRILELNPYYFTNLNDIEQ